jgi:hypothetical protein
LQLSVNWSGRIVELRGPLGPGGILIDRVRIPGKPKSTSIPMMTRFPDGDVLVISPPVGSGFLAMHGVIYEGETYYPECTYYEAVEAHDQATDEALAVLAQDFPETAVMDEEIPF